MLNWTKKFDTFCFLDNHRYIFPPHKFDCILAAGVKRKISLQAGQALQQLKAITNAPHGWLFGHLSYDLKNEIEVLSSSHKDHIGFPDLFFFEPQVLVRLTQQEMIIEADDPENIYREIQAPASADFRGSITAGNVQARLNRDQYLDTIGKLKEHILRGDCYEINFCQEFFAEDTIIDPVQVYRDLSFLSPNPFSAFYRINNSWLICASPERFLNKTGSKLLSQPMKGTSPRDHNNQEKDEQNRQSLSESSKDRSENVMVVDLVRNDLSKICAEGSVKVEELYGVYSFPQVHQMISTVTGELRAGVSFPEIIQATFPMGSMTGAPKKRVMELIGQYEQSRRGIFSGAVGYITPEDDFDFNVVIRSLMYNEKEKYLSFQAGSGITWYSDPEMEWEECLVKLEAIRKVLGIGNLPVRRR